MKLHTDYRSDEDRGRGIVQLVNEQGLIIGTIYTGLTVAEFICRKVNNLEVTADVLESPGSRMCNCDPDDNPPISPTTGQRMAHHCECRAVLASEALRRGESRTLHAFACSGSRPHPGEKL